MNGRQQQEQLIFDQAAQIASEAERAAYLDQACGGDMKLRARLEVLLEGHFKGQGFLERVSARAAEMAHTLRVNAPGEEEVGTVIGRYKLLQKVGEGGFGAVYVAEQHEPVKRRVALKIIKLGMDTRQVIARFEAERQALALMDHPNIAKVLDGGATETGRPYFVMELVRGMRITDYCDQNNLPTEERLGLFMQVCHAIQHAHQKGIIHRDIKPSNILVTVVDGRPVPKVIDFGIAKATQGQLTDKTVYTQLHQFIGTPAYMSPEQAVLSGVDVDTRSDIYSLGVLLYELLTGQPPFDPKTLLAAGLDEMRRIIRETEPPKPSTRLATALAANPHSALRTPQLKEVRGDLDWIVMKCLEKDRGRRYETANNVARDIEHYLKQEPVSAAAPGTVYRAHKFIRRHRVGVAMATAVILALGVGLVAALVGFGQAKRERDRAEAGEKKAQVAAAKSEQVAHFLKEMLQGVGPAVALGRDTTMLREILDKTAERVGKDLANRPEVEAELRTTIGDTYFQLCEFTKAEAMFREALRLRRAAPAGPKEGESLYDLARVLMRRGGSNQLAEAEVMIRRALVVQREALGAHHPDVARSLIILGATLHRQQELVEAEGVCREALAIATEVSGSSNLTVAVSLATLGIVLRDERRFEEAEVALRRALAIQKGLLGDQTLEVASSVSFLASVLSRAGKLGEAEAAYREALGLQRKLFRDGSPYAEDSDEAIVLRCLADVLLRQSKFEEAELFSGQALTLRKKLPGSAPIGVVHSLESHAAICQKRRKLEEAETFRREALEIRRKIQGDADPGMGFALASLADLLREEGKLAEAETAYREALAVRKKLFGNKHRDVDSSLGRLAQVLADQGKLGEAESVQREELATERELSGDEHPFVANSLSDLALLLEAGNKLAEAGTLLRQALAIRRKAEPALVQPTLAKLTSVLLAEEKFAEAEPPAREGLAIREKEMPDGWLTSNSRSMLGGALLGQKKYAEAEPLLVAGYEGMKCREHRIPPAGKARLHEALDRLVRLNEILAAELPGSAEYRQDLAAAYRRLLNLETNSSPPINRDCTWALAFMDQAIARGRTNQAGDEPGWWHSKGKLLEKVGRLDEALAALTKAVELTSVNTNGHALTPAEALLSRSGLLKRMNRLAEAAADRCQTLDIPARDSRAQANLVDLSLFYNGGLKRNWHGDLPENNLAALPTGIQTLMGTEFDIRGLVQVHQTDLAFPASVTNIPVGRACQRLHFLHAAFNAVNVPDRAQLGRYVVHYLNGQQREISLVLDQDLADWWQVSSDQGKPYVVAWTGTNSVASRRIKRGIRLFKTTWPNQMPEIPIQSIDFEALDKRASPFLVAITVE